MIFERLPASSLPFDNFYSNLGFWEFDLFVGYAGFAFITIGCIMWAFQMFRKKTLSPLFIPSLVLVYLAVGDNYHFLTQFLSIFGGRTGYFTYACFTLCSDFDHD